MAAPRRDSGNQLLEELEQLSQTLDTTTATTSSTTRRTASLALPRASASTSLPPPPANQLNNTSRPRSRRMSLSPWRSSRPKLDQDQDDNDGDHDAINKHRDTTPDKKGIWNWKPIRALTHIGMQKLTCLFSVDVVTAQGLPPSMNGLRLSVCVRKKETKDGAVHTMPSRVSQGTADFEETLFFKCHVYCSGTATKHLKFEPRPFFIYLFAIDAKELDLGKNEVNLSQLIQDSLQGTQLRQWDFTFSLSGKAKGGELVLIMRFQIMEKDGGIGIYKQAEAATTTSQNKNSSTAFARKQSKASFSIPSPRLTARAGPPRTPSKPPVAHSDHLQGIDDLNLDEPAPSSASAPQKLLDNIDTDDIDPPEFEVVDKGVEISEKEKGDEESQGTADDKSTSSEVVKEVLLDQLHMTRLTELDSIAQQIKALESMIVERKAVKDEDTESQRLDAEEENVTREFLQMLEDEELNDFQLDQDYLRQTHQPQQTTCDDSTTESEAKACVSDLGRGLGCVVQTRDGGYLAAMNPLDAVVPRKDTPKLAMQISKPMVLSSNDSVTGFELFQRMAVMGIEALHSQILSHMPMDELIGKTAEQIAFEGIASAVIRGREKEGGASSSAAQTVSVLKTMGTAMNAGRKDRISTGIWSANENPLTVEEMLPFSLQNIEAMAVEALKIQAGIGEEAPFQVSSYNDKAVKDAGSDNSKQPLASAIPLEDWIRSYSSTPSKGEQKESETLTLLVLVQLRDPMRRYEAVGGPVLALIHATRVDEKPNKYDGEKRYKITSLHAGGLKVSAAGNMNVRDTERQRLTAMQWLVAYGLGKGGRKGKHVLPKGRDVFWSISSRVMADMWLKPIRNPDIKFAK